MTETLTNYAHFAVPSASRYNLIPGNFRADRKYCFRFARKETRSALEAPTSSAGGDDGMWRVIDVFFAVGGDLGGCSYDDFESVVYFLFCVDFRILQKVSRTVFIFRRFSGSEKILGRKVSINVELKNIFNFMN